MAEHQNHTCRIATARIGYQARPDQRVLDTTVKSGTGIGAVFAPTWNLVMGWKRGEMSWEAYCTGYTELMRMRFLDRRDAFVEALGSGELVLCCYCKDTHRTTRQCHRYLLVDILTQVAEHFRINIEYLGELRNAT